MTIWGGSGGVRADDGVVRGEKSWASLYVALGFVLTIGGTIIQMIKPLEWPQNLVVYIAFAALCIQLFLFDGQFQRWVLGKIGILEDKPRG